MEKTLIQWLPPAENVPLQVFSKFLFKKIKLLKVFDIYLSLAVKKQHGGFLQKYTPHWQQDY